MTVRWMANSIQTCAIQEKALGRRKSTWEIRVKSGGEREIEWAEKRVGDMLSMAGLGDGRMVDDVLKCFKVIVED